MKKRFLIASIVLCGAILSSAIFIGMFRISGEYEHISAALMEDHAVSGTFLIAIIAELLIVHTTKSSSQGNISLIRLATIDLIIVAVTSCVFYFIG